MTLSTHRLLGFAFAGADLLLEIEPAGQIAFAIGASETLAGSTETALIDHPWGDFVAREDWAMLQALFDGLSPGARAGPVVVLLADRGDGIARAASLSAIRLPQNNGALSCALTRAKPPPPRGPNGLYDRVDFEAATASLYETARASGVELELALIEMGGLGAATRKLAPDAAKATEARIAGLLRAQSHGGGAATELGPDRYALVRQRGAESSDALAARMVGLLDLGPEAAIAAAGASMELSDADSAAQALRAIRYSLDNFIRDGMPPDRDLSLSDAMTATMRRTLSDVQVLNQAISERSFRLVYQPVVDLKASNALHHFEVLVRFGDNASPFPMIRMAEELDIIGPLDVAILEQTVDQLVRYPNASLAANVSGRTIISPAFVQTVRNLLAAKPQARGRLMFELTESSAIDDLATADRHLQALRAEGCKVCLDDFGAGAASLAYLQQLSLDVVKIDGRYIRELQHGGRESTFIRHLVSMCDELGVKTLAEMVETPQAEEAVRRAGVDYAQGWLYGAALDQPVMKPPPAAAATVSHGRAGQALSSRGVEKHASPLEARPISARCRPH